VQIKRTIVIREWYDVPEGTGVDEAQRMIDDGEAEGLPLVDTDEDEDWSVDMARAREGKADENVQ